MPARISSVPNVHERVVLQALLAGEWKTVRSAEARTSSSLEGMISKGWIERCRGASIKAEFRITESGRAVFRARIP